MKYLFVVFNLTVLLTVGSSAIAQSDQVVVELRFEDHHFTPRTITAPANQPLRIKVINASQETIEFESFKLNREKVVGPGETIIVILPGLSPGNYDFYDDFHQDVPEGVIIAK